MDDDEFEAVMAAAREHERGKKAGTKRSRSGGIDGGGPAVVHVQHQQQQLEQRKRDEALERGAANNPAWKLLQKAGFDEKTVKERANEALARMPALVVPMRGRGLGLEREEKEKAMAALRVLQESQDVTSAQFHAATKARFEGGKVRRQFNSALRLAHDLDESRCSLVEDRSAWYRLFEERHARDDREHMELDYQEEVHENLLRCVNYLRSVYACCFWCGVCYDSLNDMNAQCPGQEEEQH